MAARYEAELVVLRVTAGRRHGRARGRPGRVRRRRSARACARSCAAPTTLRRAIVEAAREEDADVLVVGSVGHAGPQGVPARQRAEPRLAQRALHRRDRQHQRQRVTVEPEVEGTLLGRAAQIGRVMARHGLSGRGGTTRDRARGFREALEELGPTFAKLGQVLSTRPDLLPPEFVEELEIAAGPGAADERGGGGRRDGGGARRALGGRVRERRAAAARRRDDRPGPQGAARERRGRRRSRCSGPTAREEILRDLGLLSLFAEKTQNRPVFRQVVDLPAVIEHLSTSLRRELDFTAGGGQRRAAARGARAVLPPRRPARLRALHVDAAARARVDRRACP